jgi:hypothetical protein
MPPARRRWCRNGYVFDWPQGHQTREEGDELWPDNHLCDGINPLTLDPFRLDWIDRLTPEQAVQEAAEVERIRNDPEIQAPVQALLGRFLGMPS